MPADPQQLIVNNPRTKFDDRVVCLGEVHTHPLHHRMQFNMVKATHHITKASADPLAIGLEMFYRQQQVTYVAMYHTLKNKRKYVANIVCWAAKWLQVCRRQDDVQNRQAPAVLHTHTGSSA